MKVLENGNIVCKKVKKENEGGFIILDETKKYIVLEVVIGDYNKNCKEGDKVYVPYQAATKVEVDGEVLFSLNIKNIMFII